ncbi:MAG: hypothetical protein QG577_428 [Thermodesulfobacteriota bacterium]|nr:hypothetical protein [Thermodesulfobacteriota bacterium]
MEYNRRCLIGVHPPTDMHLLRNQQLQDDVILVTFKGNNQKNARGVGRSISLKKRISDGKL